MKRPICVLVCISSFVLCLATTISADNNSDIIEVQPGTYTGDGNDYCVNSHPVEYVSNEIIIKFHETTANTVETQLESKTPAKGLTLSQSLDELNARYQVTKIKPVFKNFRDKRRQIKTLLRKDKALLSKKEKHILRRLKRAPKGAKAPDLNRIYRIQVELEPGQSLEDAVAAYNSNPDVEYAELNYIVSTYTTPNDTYYTLQWPLNNIGQSYPTEEGETASGTPDCDIDAPEAWDIYTGSSEVIVAVVDTGVDCNHRDLQSNLWVNEIELNGDEGVDDDENGYIDDIYGYDFINNDGDPKDDHGHGTHCSGIIAAVGNNNLDIAGVCWSAKIMGLKFLDSAGYGTSSDAITAFYYAVANGADVISNSWGGGHYSETMEQAINYAYSQGVTIVAAAGNDNSDSPHYPAYYDYVTAVAATDSNDQKASFSNYGDWVDIAAPGVDILSLRADGTSMGTVYDSYTTIASGTSMACPHISGACALLLSINPFTTCDEIYNILMDTADTISPGICQSGRLNIHNAMVNAVTSKGHINLDRDYYNCDCNVGIFLADGDLAGTGSWNVTVTCGADWETVALNEKTPAIGVFTGEISTASGGPNTGNSILEVSHGQIITATYEDADDGTGNPASPNDTAVVDCVYPVISNLTFNKNPIGPYITISFDTNEYTSGRVLYGLSCGGAYSGSPISHGFSHTINLIEVSPWTDYYFIIEAIDIAGNRTTDTNEYNCYYFTTDGPNDINVPGDYNSIQEAIDHSWDDGTVTVAVGTYTGEGNRDIDFRGKAITVRSTDPNDPNVAAATIIDCNGSVTEPHRGFYFHNNEDANSIVNGFTITNGYGPCDYWDGYEFRYAGGGISCYNSSPTIKNCTIIGNRTSYSPGYGDGLGAGICCDNSSSTIQNCNIIGNTSGYATGGAIFGHNTNVSITNCEIRYNYGGSGGGIYIKEGNPTIQRCFISNNDFFGRGSLYFEFYCDAKVINCIISKNTSSDLKAGIYCANHCEIIVTNCTIADNSRAAWGGGIYCDYQSTALVTNCICWGNSQTDLPPMGEREIYTCSDSSATVTYSNVAGGIPGLGNINEDPLFLGVNPLLPPADYYYLGYMGQGSFCIDAGTNNPPGGLPGTDLDGSPRPVNTADMGAYELGVSLPPIIWCSPSKFQFYAVEGESNPANQILSIRKISPPPFSWEITEGCAWLEVTPNSGENYGEVDEVTLSVDTSGLGLGTYYCILTITSAEAINSPHIVVVELVIERPEIELSTNEFRFLTMPGGPNPPDQILTIRNSGIGTLNWTIDYNCDWLQVDPNTGSSAGEPNEVVLSVDCTGFEEGIYTCDLTVSDPCAKNSPQTIEVILHIGNVELLVPSEYPTIQAAIYYAEDDDTVIVANGIYTGTGNRNIDFLGKAITVKSENGPENCIIDAEYLGQVFVFYNGEGADSIVDGFTIIQGQMYCEPGKPCPISRFGGGIYCDEGSPTIRNCIISDNLANFGGGIYAYGSPVIINCVFTNNSSEAICADANTQIINCTITRNSMAVDLWGDSIIINSILWDNSYDQLSVGTSTVIYCDIQNGWPGIGNIDTDPYFADPCNGDYHLKSTAGRWDSNSQSWVTDSVTSPCIDAGNPSCSLGDEPSNANNVRINMGAYGGTIEASKTPPNWRRITDLTNDWAVDFNDLAGFVDHWLDSGWCIPGDLTRNETVNLIDYAVFANNWLWQ